VERFLLGQMDIPTYCNTAALLPWLLWAIDGYGAAEKEKPRRAAGVLVAVSFRRASANVYIYSFPRSRNGLRVVMWRAAKQSNGPQNNRRT